MEEGDKKGGESYTRFKERKGIKLLNIASILKKLFGLQILRSHLSFVVMNLNSQSLQQNFLLLHLLLKTTRISVEVFLDIEA